MEQARLYTATVEGAKTKKALKRQLGFWQRLRKTRKDSPPSLTTCGSWRKSWTKWSVIGPALSLQKRPLEGRARLRVVPVLLPETGRVETLPLHAALVRTQGGPGVLFTKGRAQEILRTPFVRKFYA